MIRQVSDAPPTVGGCTAAVDGAAPVEKAEYVGTA